MVCFYLVSVNEYLGTLVVTCLIYSLIGGGIKEEAGVYRAEVCVFTCDASIAEMKKHVQIIRNLTRRFKYLTKTFEESMVKILKFLKGFKSEERTRLAVFSGLILAEGLVAGTILSSLLNEHLVKEGVALSFITKCFEVWLVERDISSVGQVLRKAKMDFKLLVSGNCVCGTYVHGTSTRVL